MDSKNILSGVSDLDTKFDTSDFDSADDLLDSGIDASPLDDIDSDIDMDGDTTVGDSDHEDAEVYTDGTPVDNYELLGDSDDEDSDDVEKLPDADEDLMSNSGDLVVMHKGDPTDAFTYKVIDINNIIITKRIRQDDSSDAITKSIKSTGLLDPLVVAPTVTKNTYVLISGFRRILGCARAGIKDIPCIVNNNVTTSDIPILESMYNHSKRYNIKEMIAYIDYLENQKGIRNSSMIEYLLQMNPGDYTKLKDILADNDDDIVTKLYDGIFTIDLAFKKLEQKRKKMSSEEKLNKQSEDVYSDEKKSGVDQIAGSGEEGDGQALSDEQLENLKIDPEKLDDYVEDSDLNAMVEADNNIEGFEAHKQNVGEREYIDPAIRKAVMARDKTTCQCCKRGGEQYSDILDYHHILPVFLGGADTAENGIMLCVACHRLVHLYSTGDLHIDSALLDGEYDDIDESKKITYPNKEIFDDEKARFKRVIFLGGKIRQGIAQKGMNREQYKKEHSNAGIGRRKPGLNNQEKA